MSLLPSATSCCSPCESSTTTTTNISDLIDAAVATRLGWVSVKDYGATGDGATDDTDAIQEALTVANGEKIVYFPPGTYKKVGSISVQNGSHLFGTKATITGTDNAPFFILGIDNEPLAPTRIFKPKFENLRLIGTTAGTSETGIYYSGDKPIQWPMLRNVEITGMGGNAIELNTTSGITHLSFEDCRIHGIGGFAAKLTAEYINAGNWTRVDVQNCFEGIHFLPATGAVNGVQAQVFINCTGESNGQAYVGGKNMDASWIKSEHNWFFADFIDCYAEGNAFFDSDPSPNGHNIWAAKAHIGIYGGVFASSPNNILVTGESHATVDGTWVQNTTAVPANNKGCFINDGGSGSFHVRNLHMATGYTASNIITLLNGSLAKRHISFSTSDAFDRGNGGFERLQLGSPSTFAFCDYTAGAVRFYNRTTPQALHVYNTVVGNNFEYAGLTWDSNNALFGTVKGGTGTLRSLYLVAQDIRFRTAGTDRFSINSSGHLVAGVDNAYDLGEGANFRPRNVHVGTKVFSPTAQLSALPAYADNAAATTGGLVTGDLYQVTGSDPRQVAVVF